MALGPNLKDELCDQIHDCINKRGVHQECDVGWFRQDLNPNPPTRLIEVDTNDPSIVRLIVTAEDLRKDLVPKYLTLSYCFILRSVIAGALPMNTPKLPEQQ